MTTSSLSAFLGEIGRHKLLTPEQELTLGRKVQAMVPLQDKPVESLSEDEKRVLRLGERAVAVAQRPQRQERRTRHDSRVGGGRRAGFAFSAHVLQSAGAAAVPEPRDARRETPIRRLQHRRLPSHMSGAGPCTRRPRQRYSGRAVRT